MVSESFSGDPTNPGAIIRMISGDNKMPNRASIVSIIESNKMADPASLKASSFPLFVRYSVKTGINAMLNDPSAKRRLNKLGILNATKNASEPRPAPKYPAITTSLRNPKMRLNKVALPMIPAALVTRVFSCMGIWGLFFSFYPNISNYVKIS
jgi:hypothetical protein